MWVFTVSSLIFFKVFESKVIFQFQVFSRVPVQIWQADRVSQYRLYWHGEIHFYLNFQRGCLRCLAKTWILAVKVQISPCIGFELRI